MTSFQKKPLHEKTIIFALLALLFFFALIKIFSYFSLSNAVAKRDMSRVKLLLKLGLDVNAKNRKTGMPLPIFLAVGDDDKNLLDLLIAYGADINSKDGEGTTVLEYAIRLNKKLAAKLLVEKGAKLDDCDLYLAARGNNTELIELLLAKGLDVNAACHPSSLKILPENEYLSTPLYAAILTDSSEAADVLIDHGAIVNLKKNNNYSPLHAAASMRARKTMKLLISRGAKINTKDQEGHTPLYYATKTEDIELQQTLITAGAIRN